MNWNPFKKKEEEDSFDPLSDLSLPLLKPGYVLDYDLKTWQVTAHNRYDYDGDWTDEWELTCTEGVLYLEREVDDDETWAVYAKISLPDIKEDVRASIMEDEDPPNTVTFDGVAYEAESSDAGHFHRGGEKATGGSGKEFVNWTYVDDSEKKVLVIEQWGENDFAASAGEFVKPFQFSNILPGGG
jgi:hypothetical protein